MTILVTGCTGFIGSNFVHTWLSSTDETVVNLDKLTYAGNLANLDSLKGDRRHVFVQGDIGDRALVGKLLAEYKPHAVLNFAAESHVDRSIHGPGDFIETNVVGTLNLLESVRAYWQDLPAAEKEAFRFLHVSTDEVYGTLSPTDPPFAETKSYEPNSPYSATPTAIPEVLILEPKVFGDDRGFFFESFNARDFAQDTGLDVGFVQDNHSKSARGVLRGLHYQIEHPQGKLVRVVQGEVFDVAVDLRRSSPTLGKWVGVHLNADNHRQLWVPPGFAHGFMVLSESAEFLYKTTDYWFPEHERSLLWNDLTVGIAWPMTHAPQLAAKDAAARSWAKAEKFN